MTAQEIKQLKDHEIIGFHRSMPAFKAMRMDWRDQPNLVQRRRIPPPEITQLPQLENTPSPTVWQKTRQSTTYIDPDNNLN